MKKDDISRLLQRYLSAKEEGKEPYFDADQIDDLLDSFEDSNDYTYFDEVLALGLKLHPGNSALQIKKGRQFAYNEDYESALALLENIAETDNQDLDMLKLECYCSLNRYPKVLEIIEELIARECDYLEEIFEYISPILNDLDMYKEARDFIDRGLALFPENLILKNELCYILEVEGDVHRAIDLCNELIDNNPFSYEYWFMLGRLHSMVGDYEKAIEAFDFALTCDDSDMELKILKAYCLYMNESYEKAIEVYQEVEGDEEMIRRISPLMAECYMKLEKYEDAYQLLSTIINDPDMEDGPSNYINYIRCCTETGDENEASKMLFKAAQLYPDNLRILSLLTIYLLDRGKKEEAVAITNKIFKIIDKKSFDPETQEECDSLLHAGHYLYSKGEVDKAISYYKKVLQINPKTPMIHIHLAMAYFYNRDKENFMEHLSQISGDDLLYLIHEMGPELLMGSEFDFDKKGKYIQPKDLVKEFLKNKDNSN
ncbi:CDC27 family protein [uncultured Parabacteroides sp.]|uniref:tetratricopeptide repeat protein n=1 Tax=uncultured Parabacteroides sp. TaxID=512312 RepID=UPI002629D1E4|nr:CDC27 family protein [uncultured Parabacteroides sp.]